jgi:hypothetical protein
MTADMTASVRASRLRVPRTRGALSGALLLVLGAWAGLVAFIGPYFDFAFTPAPDDAWRWTAARGYLEVVPAAAAFVGGLLLLLSASRVTTSLGGWLGAAGGAWLIVGPPLATFLNIDLGTPDPSSSTGVQSLETLFYFYGIGAAILFVASLALGRLSVHSLRDIRAAERRAATEAAERRAATEAAAGQARHTADEPTATDTHGPGDYQDRGNPHPAGHHEQAPGDQQTAATDPPPSGGAQASQTPQQYPPSQPTA